MKHPIIAIDGPAASGKGTLCRRLAAGYGFDLLDTGLLYRAVAAHCVQAHLPLADETRIADFVRNLQTIDTHDQALLRTEAMGGNASQVSKYPAVRQRLFDYQREFGHAPPHGRGAILDGRDIGTVIFPETPYKIYLSASAKVRAERRYVEMLPDGGGNFAAILADVERRDHDDQNRTIAPLRPAEDALVLDSSDLSPDAVYAQAQKYLAQCGLTK